MNLANILSLGERVIVLSVAGIDEVTLFTWNQSGTLQRWDSTDGGVTWEESGILSLFEQITFLDAKRRALKWYADMGY